MGVFAGPKISTDGLIFSLDARNSKTYDEIPGITDHGISDWYCFVGGTVTYSAIYPNTEIIEIDANGNEVGIVTTGSEPQRGTFTTTADRRYYGTKAVHLLQTTAGDDQHELAPVSFAGTYFAHFWGRNSPTTYYAYAPQDDTTLEFFDNNATGGVTGIATATHNILKGFTTSFTSTAINTWQFFKADKPIIMTAGGTGWDKTILAPATQYNYKRRNASNITINNTSPSGIGNYVTYDTSLPVVTVEIADGAGGDATQGIGYENLSNTYSWGNALSDYHITAPYANTTVTVSYWANGQWNIGEVHSLSGTQTNPDTVDRDGTNGFGVDGGNIAGTAAYLASGANLWKFEGTQPFALIINDTVDDEERLLGWMSDNYLRTSSNVTQSFVNLIDKDDRSRMKIYGTPFNSLTASDYFEFDGVDDRIQTSYGPQLNDFTIIIWFKSTGGTQNYNRIVDKDYNTGLWIGRQSGLSNSWGGGVLESSFPYGRYITLPDGQWNMIVSTRQGTTHTIYGNGITNSVSGTVSSSAISATTFAFGNYSGSNNLQRLTGNIAQVFIYDRALTPQEIQQNYNATKSRYL